MSKSIRVAVVGCGQIADAHLGEIRKIGFADLVGVCDQIPELARQAAARFGVSAEFTDVSEMLAAINPDVVHITTPPQSHLAISRQCFEHGVHVYVEKPFAVNEAEARQLLEEARRRNCAVCAGHDQLFDPLWLRVRELVERGAVGQVVHIESIQGYNIQGPFGRVVLCDPNHWVRRLPGGLLQNTMIHALYRIDDLLRDGNCDIAATAFSPEPEIDFPTELRATLVSGAATANLVFTSQARPLQRVVRIAGERGSLEVDFDSQILKRIRSASLPGAFGVIEAPTRELLGASGALTRNLWRFLKSDLQYFGGMRRLFEGFYRSVLGESELPISPDDALRVVRLTDRILAASKQYGSLEDSSCSTSRDPSKIA